MAKKLSVLCFIFSSCSMLYYLLLTRLLVEFTGDVMLWTSVSSGFYLCALGSGIFWAERPVRQEVARMVGWLEAAATVWGSLAVVLLYLWHMVYRIYMSDFGYDLQGYGVDPRLIFGGLAQLLLIGVGLLAGLEFGLISKMLFRTGLASVQRMIAIYQFGGLIGSLLLLLVFIPHFEPLHIAFAVSLSNAVATALWAFSFAPTRVQARQSFSRLFLAQTSMLLLLLTFSWRSDLLQAQRKNFYYNSFEWTMAGSGTLTYSFPKGLLTWFSAARSYPDIERHRGVYQNIDLVREPEVPIPYATAGLEKTWTLFMDGHFELNSESEIDYHQAMAHIPTVLLGRVAAGGDAPDASHRSGAKVLIIGGGDGMLVRELLRYGDKIRSVTLVDIDPQILHLADNQSDLLHLNQASLSDPKVTKIAADAFQTVRGSRETFDKIYVDVLFPFNFETSRLYSVEFFKALYHHLAPDGHLSVLSPVEIGDMNDDSDQSMLQVLASTFYEAGFQDLYLYGEVRHTFFLALPRHAAPLTEVQQEASPFYSLIRNPSHMDQIERVDLPLEPKLVNSILHPTFFGQHDTNF